MPCDPGLIESATAVRNHSSRIGVACVNDAQPTLISHRSRTREYCMSKKNGNTDEYLARLGGVYENSITTIQ